MKNRITFKVLFYFLIYLPVAFFVLLMASARLNVSEIRILILTIRLHGLQQRKYTFTPYWFHPLSVAMKLKNLGFNELVVAAALLHDVLEDTNIKSDELLLLLESVFRKESANRVLSLVGQLTDVYTKANYPDLNRKERKLREAFRLGRANLYARNIKLADIIDNGQDIRKNDPIFFAIYQSECLQLVSKLHPNAHPALVNQAEAILS